MPGTTPGSDGCTSSPGSVDSVWRRRGSRWWRTASDSSAHPHPAPATSSACTRRRPRSMRSAATSRRPVSCRRSSPARNPGASSSASRGPVPTSPASRRWRCATATSGWCTARRCGPVAPAPRAGRSSWRAPIPTSPSTAASRSSCATCSSPGSRSARCARPTAPRTSTRCSSTVCACPTTCAWATPVRGGRSRWWGCTPNVRESARSCRRRSATCWRNGHAPARPRRSTTSTGNASPVHGSRRGSSSSRVRTQPRRAGPGRRDAVGSLQKVARAAANQRTSSLLVDLMGPAGQVGFDYDAAHRDDVPWPTRRRRCRSYARAPTRSRAAPTRSSGTSSGSSFWAAR